MNKPFNQVNLGTVLEMLTLAEERKVVKVKKRGVKDEDFIDVVLAVGVEL